MEKSIEQHTEKKIKQLVKELEEVKRDRDYWKRVAQRKNGKKLEKQETKVLSGKM